MIALLEDSLGGAMLVRARRRSLPADVLIFGLADAVAPEAKELAQAQVAAAAGMAPAKSPCG
jgi:citrate lyase beta subunit